jgi:hypothetical protein
MTRKFIYVSAFLAMFSFVFTSCGGSSSSGDELDHQMENLDSEIEDETAVPAVESLDVSSISSAEDAMDKYKSMLEEYAELVKNGSVDEAQTIKVQLDELQSFAESEWGKSSLKAMSNLTKLALQLEAGKYVDLDGALKAYDKSLKVLKDLPGAADYEKEMSKAQDAMNDAMNQFK